MQVRCMVAVLLMVGKQQEHHSIVAQLLDVDTWGCKPQYKMADEVGSTSTTGRLADGF